MKKTILIASIALTISSTLLAEDWCQLNIPCPLYSDMLIESPYVGTYTCELSAGDMEDITVELTLLTKNTIAYPESLILSKGPHSGGKKSGEIRIVKNPLGREGASLKNAISISAPKEPVFCDYTKPHTCDVPRTVTCKRIGA